MLLPAFWKINGGRGLGCLQCPNLPGFSNHQFDWIFTTTSWRSFCGRLPLASFDTCSPCMPQGLCLYNQFPLPGIPYRTENCLLLDLKTPSPKSLPCAPTPASFPSYSLPHVPSLFPVAYLPP